MRRFGRDAKGQSFVEVALALPILMLLVLGIADLGRFALYSIAITHAARDAAAYVVEDLRVDDANVKQRVCGELGLDGPSCTGLTVTCSRGVDLTCNPAFGRLEARAAPTVRVSVRFDLPLLTGIITERLGMRAVPLRGESTFAGYTQ